MPISFNPHAYQDTAIDFTLDRPYSALILDMGLGKTVITLTVLKALIYDLEVIKPLIVAPKFVTGHTWPAELEKWSHLKGLTISVIAGTPKQREAAVRAIADIHIVSRDNIAWLVDYLGKKWRYDMLVLDELSSFKNGKSKRFKAVRTVRPKAKRVIGLTGTPAPNGLMDLWAQMYLIDQGERLHKFIGSYREAYFHEERKLDYGGTVYGLDKGAEAKIFAKIKDIALSMKASDHLDLPKRIDIVKEIPLDDYTEYKAFRREKILELPEQRITAFNAPSLYSKLLQYSNGAVYDDDKNYHIVHDLKLEALAEMVEELNGKPVIISYQFQSDIDRIMKRIPGVTRFKNVKQIPDWNAGKIPILLAHAKSMGHGLNLQDGGHYVIHYGVPASLEDYWQLVKRVDRQGQRFPVFNIHLTIKGTSESKAYPGLLAKTADQDRLFVALR